MQWAAFFACLMVFVVLSEARSFSSNIKKNFPSKKISKLRTLSSNKLREFDNTRRFLNAHLSPLQHRKNDFQTRDNGNGGLPMSTVRVMAFAAGCFLSEEFWHYVCFDKIDDHAWEYEGPEWAEACFYSIRFVMYYVDEEASPEDREYLDYVFDLYDHGATCERLGHRRGEMEAELFLAEKCGKEVLYQREELAFLEELTMLIHFSCTKNGEELDEFENAWEEEYDETEMTGGETEKRAEKKELLEQLSNLLSSPRQDTRRSVRSADTCELNNEFFGGDGKADIAVLQAAVDASYCITGDIPEDVIPKCNILLDVLENITEGTSAERAKAVGDINDYKAAMKCEEFEIIDLWIGEIKQSEETFKVKDAVDRYAGFLDRMLDLLYCGGDKRNTKRGNELSELKKKLLDALSQQKK